MSKSRLEKFLYALYSLDSSDLPNPLSRIEELYKCLVTGEEVPTFKPLSRVEKYLMAILGVYDVDSLPNPISRVEVLLYKLAVGDDNLDDVKSFLSEHEELLAEIIRNGGVGGDIEYVLYTLSTESNTLYNTAEKPVKSAILKGCTLNNIVKNFNSLTVLKADVEKEIEIQYLQQKESTIIINVSSLNTNKKLFLQEYQDSTWLKNNALSLEIGVNKVLFTPSQTTTKLKILSPGSQGVQDVNVEWIMIIQDNVINNVIENHFTGMSSVKMPVLTTVGKNLFDGEIEEGVINTDTGEPTSFSGRSRSKKFIKVPKNTDLYISIENGGVTSWTSIYAYDESKNYLGCIINSSSHNKTFNTGNASYIKWKNNASMDTLGNVQIECGTSQTTYEPYKSNILTVNEEVELRRIGDVKDELNLMTGELTQRVGEIVLDGSEDENWGRNGTLSNGHETSFFTIGIDNVKRGMGNITKKCDKFIVHADYSHPNDIEGVHQIVDNQISIRVLKTSLSDDSSEGLKAYLRHNPITIQYRFITESIKTVDLSVVDKNGDNTKLSTFDDITHVTLSSEGLIPEAELEVATKNEEDLEDSIVYTTHTLSEESNTLYNTAEKPVKSAVLKGQTLVNIVNNDNWVRGTDGDINLFTQNISIKKDQTYTVIGKMEIGDVLEPVTANNAQAFRIRTGTDNSGTTLFFIQQNTDVVFKQTFTNNENDTIHVRFFNQKTNYKKLMIIEGDHTQEDISYFEGMQSVKMPVLTTTGKNLFDGKLEFGDIDSTTGEPVNHPGRSRSKNFIKVIPSNSYFMYSDSPIDSTNFGVYIYQYDSNRNYIGLISVGEKNNVNLLNQTFTVDDDCHFIKIRTTIVSTLNFDIGVMSDGKNYEPYKSNILTVNEEVELHGVGDVQDTLDLMTGEVTQRIGEIVLNGGENWWFANSSDNPENPNEWSHSENTWLLGVDFTTISSNTHSVKNTISDKYPVYYNYSFSDSEYFNILSGNNALLFRVRKDRFSDKSIVNFKSWLSQNPITIQYQFTTESVKTVDLSVVDKNGDNTKLSTFDDITHVTLSSEGLIPEAELEVAEKVTEIAASMLTISHDQEVIDTATNKQSENADATMLATTEIYEGLL